MQKILREIRGGTKYLYEENDAATLWRDKVTQQPKDTTGSQDIELIKQFNQLILAGFDVKAHYESLRDKEKFKEVNYNEKLAKVNYEINNLHLINENLSSFAYYELGTRRKPKLVREKGKTGYQIFNKVLRHKYDTAHHTKTINNILAALNVKKQVRSLALQDRIRVPEG